MLDQLRVGITAKNFYMWDGGIDFIATVAQGLEYDKSTSTFLLLKRDSFLLKNAKIFKIILKNRFLVTRIREEIHKYYSRYDKLIKVFKECSPNTKVIWYKGNYINDDKSLMKTLKNNEIDVLLPHNGFFVTETPVPWVGYMYDFQHEYLPGLFDPRDIIVRRKELKKRLDNSRYVIVNAKKVESDIRKFYPENNSIVFSLPFAPFQKPEHKKDLDLTKYKLPSRYYMISNQFWRHKNHLVAFEALDNLYNSGCHNLHIVCSGKMEDSRDPLYVNDLLQKVHQMNCSENIHFLGYIPKADQIEIMRNAVGLIQPTLCEGGPGGGSVYNALCLGLPCLVSNIEVNREIVGYDNVFFFDPLNAPELAKMMMDHMMDSRYPEEYVDMRIKENMKIYSKSLINIVRTVIQNN